VPATNQRKPRTEEFSVENFLKEAEEIRRREEARKEMLALMAEDGEDDELFERDENRLISATTEAAIGKEGSEKLKEALARVGGDMVQEGGFRFFKSQGEEREFQFEWVKDTPLWSELFEGLSG
jgi:hypothetical protein